MWAGLGVWAQSDEPVGASITVTTAPTISDTTAPVVQDTLLTFTPGVYAPADGGLITQGFEVWINGVLTSTATSDTPVLANEGETYMVREVVSEAGGGTLIVTLIDTTVRYRLPVAAGALPDQLLDINQPMTPLDIAADFTGPALTFTLQSGAEPVDLIFNGTTLSGTPSVAYGLATLVYRATNPDGNFADTAFQIDVDEPLNPPIAGSFPDYVGTAGSGPHTIDLTTGFSGGAVVDFFSDQPWAVVSGNILTINDAERTLSVVTITADNADTDGVDVPMNVTINAAAGSGDWPLDAFGSGQTGVWLDPSDLTSMWTTDAKTTQVAADGDDVGHINDKSGNVTHFKTTGTVGANDFPFYKTDGTKHWLDFTGIFTRLWSVIDLPLPTANMVLWMKVRVEATDTRGTMMAELNSATRTMLKLQDGDTGGPDGNAGTPTYYVDDVLVSPANKDTLWDLIATGVDVVIRVENFDMTNSWGSLQIGREGSTGTADRSLAMRLYEYVLVDSPDAAALQGIEDYMNGISGGAPANPPIAGAFSDFNGVEGAGPHTVDLSTGFTGGTPLSYSSSEVWAVVSGSTLTINDVERATSPVDIIATNADGSSLPVTMNVTIAPVVDPPIAGSFSAFVGIQGAGPHVIPDLSVGFTGGAPTSYSSDQAWAVVSGSTLTIDDTLRNGEIVNITATNADGSSTPVPMNVTIGQSGVLSISNTPTGSFTVNLIGSGQITITVDAPSIHAGTYGPYALDFADGVPINLALPSSSTPSGAGNVLTGVPALWAYNPVNGIPVVSNQWWADLIILDGETSLTHTETANDQIRGLYLAETAINGAGISAEARAEIIPVFIGTAMADDVAGLHWYKMAGATITTGRVSAITDDKGSADLAEVGSILGPVDNTDHMSFNGNEGLRSSVNGSMTTTIDGGNDITVFIVADGDTGLIPYNTIKNGRMLCENEDTGAENRLLFYSPMNNFNEPHIHRAGFVTANNSTFVYTPDVAQDKAIYEYRIGATTLDIYSSGVLLGSTTYTATDRANLAQRISLGAQLDNTGGINEGYYGDIYEVFVTSDNTPANLDPIREQLGAIHRIILP